MFKNLGYRYILNSFILGLKAIVLFLLTLVLARSLGPEVFGIFIFLTSILISVWSILDIGIQKGFFTFISEEVRPKAYFYGYGMILLIQLLIISLAIYFIPDVIFEKIFSNNSKEMVWVCFASVLSQKSILNMSTLIAESKRKNIIGNSVETASYIFQLSFIFYLLSSSFDEEEILFTIFLVQISINIIFSLITILLLKEIFLDFLGSIKRFFLDIFSYIKPFAPYLILGGLVAFFDNWLLISMAGAEGQAFYGFSLRFIAMAHIASAAFLNILWKEVSEARNQGNLNLIKEIALDSINIFWALSSSIAIIIAVYAEELILILMGKDYYQAISVTHILCLYIPIHTLGAIIVTLYYSSRRATEFIIINSIFLILGVLISMKLISDYSWVGGYDLGANGMALKLLIISAATHITAFFRYFRGISYIEFLLKFILPIISLGSLAFIIKAFLIIYFDDLLLLLLGGISYILVLFLLFFYSPKFLFYRFNPLEVLKKYF